MLMRVFRISGVDRPTDYCRDERLPQPEQGQWGWAMGNGDGVGFVLACCLLRSWGGRCGAGACMGFDFPSDSIGDVPLLLAVSGRLMSPPLPLPLPLPLPQRIPNSGTPHVSLDIMNQ